MNKLRYRVIFNKALGVMMAVSELAKSHRPNTTNGVKASINFKNHFFNLNRLTWLTSLVFANVMWLLPANANIVADPNAAGNQKPIITQSANGTPQINIQTPSAAGVSRNKYSQFDVTEKGVILNNSRKPTQTEQGGWVDGNQWLATGEARIILNEVNSKNPSQLKGFVEVAGQKAQVIIANPAGITCEGCGFINSDRATMTTGTVNIVNGAVTGYQINDGKIVIQGKGLDSSRQDHTDLIARAVEVNSDVWANDLAVTTGQNQVDADNIKITKNNEQKNSNKPTIAIDVSDLGGMYAGKIRLVGTEEGVGVRNTGEIGASAGNMIVTADGKLINTGTINSKQNIIVTTTDNIENGGTLYADQNSNLTTQDNVENTGVIVAKGNIDINALSLANTKTGLIAGGINEKGKRETQGDVTVNTSGKVTTQGEIIASDKISIEASHIDASESYFEADDINLTANAGDIQTSASSLLADKNINIKAASALNNDKGIWVAKEAIHIDLAKSLNQNISAKNELRTVGPIGMSNQQGIIQAGSGLTIETHNYTLDNQQGMLASFGDLNFNTGDIINRTGQISSTNHINMTSFTLDNDNAGIIQSGGDLSIHTQGSLLSNIQSQLSSDQVGGILSSGTLSLNTGDINNTDGNIYAQSHINIHSNNINNFRGKITGLNSIDMLTGAVNNIEGIIQAKGTVSLDSQSNTLDNTEGFLFSADTLTLKLGDLNNTSGTISSLGDLNAITSDVNNTNGLVQSDALILWKMEDADWQNHNGILMAQKNLILNANNLTNQTGEIYIGGNGQLILNHLDNTESGNITSQNNIEIKTKDIDNRKGIILTQNSLTFDNSGILNNDSGLLSSLGQLSIQTNVLKNIQGIMEAAEGLSLSADTLLNEGDILSFGDMSISLNQTLKQLGLIQANNHLSLNIIHGLINSGTIQAGSKFTLTAEQIDNQADGEISAGALLLQAQDTVTNRGLIDGLLTQVEAAHALNNLGTGRIYGDYLAIKTPYLNNRNENGIAATIAARERLDIGFHTLDNYEHSLIYSAGDMALGGDLNEQGFAIGQAYVLNNHSATIESAHDMYLSSQYINNINDHFSTDVVVVANKNVDPKLGGIYEYAFSNSGQRYNKTTNSIREDVLEVLHLTVDNIGPSDDYYRWIYDREIQETVITQSDPAKIVSGGNLVINATEVLNDKSQILAGKTFTLDADSLNNVAVQGIRIITDEGSVTHLFRIKEKGSDSQGADSWRYPLVQQQEITLEPSIIEYNTTLPPSSLQLSNVSELKPGAPIITEVALRQNTTDAELEEITTPIVVRYTPPNTLLPDSSLYQVNPDQKADYLIATDPRFTDKKLWLGSEYMLAAFNINHDNQHKRLGDGYYEQQLIKEQIISLTGNRYLGDYTNDEEQYKALMDAGIAFADKFNLTPGIALSPEQITSLTTDLVWLVTQTVTLPDGTTQEVLVPQVYAKVQPSDLDGTGALLSAKNMQLNLKNDLNNSGKIQTGQTLLVNANNINNNAGQLIGKEIGLTAKQDINNIGGSIVAADTLIAKAGRDINVITTTKSTDSGGIGTSFNRTIINQVGGISVTNKEGILVLDAENDINLTAASIVNQGEDSLTQIKAGNNITLNTVQIREQNHIGSGDNYWRQESSTEVGTQIYGGGDVTLSAGNDLDSAAASVTADKALNVQAGNNLTLREGIATETLDSQTKTTSKGLLSGSTTTTRTQIDNQTSIGSQFNGETITLSAGQDLTVQGSDVIADEALSLKAGNDVNITTAKEQYYTQTTTETKKSGLMSGGGLGVFIGKKSEKNDDSSRDGVEVGSTIGSLNGDVLIQAGNQATIHGSEVIAGGDINAIAKNIDITAAANTHDEKHITETKSSGFTVSLGGSVGSALSSAVSSASQTSRSNSDRKNALLGISSALSGAQAVEDYRLADAQNNFSGTVGVNVSYGSQSSRSEQTLNQVNHAGSNLTAGGDINLVATEQDILVQGSTLEAANNLTLDAKRDILLQAAEDTSKLEGKNESKGGSLGVTYNGGWGVNAGFNKGKGSENGNGVTNIATELNAGNLITLNSGRDTQIIGSQVKGEGVDLTVGNDLRIESLQDSDSYHSKQTDVSANVSVGAGSFGGGLSASKTKMDSDYASVQEQAGIFAGTKGVDIEVGNNTHLKGGTIASEGENNSLSTGTLTFEDIKNKAEFDVSSSGIGINGNLNLGESAQHNGLGGFSTPGATHSNNSGDSESDTKATIGGNIDITFKDKEHQTQDITSLNRDTNNAHQSLETIFDKDKEQSRLDEQQLMADIGNQLSNLVRTEGQIRAEKAKSDENALKRAENELLAEGKEPSKQEIEQRAQNNAQRDWGTGGKYQQVTQALTGALQGALGGDITKALANGTAPYLAEAIKKATTNPDGSINLEANLGAHAILGALLSHANGNNALAGGVSTLTAEAAANLIKDELYGDKSFADLTEDERQNISALAQIAAGLAGGLTGDRSSDTAQGAIAGKNAVENNKLFKSIIKLCSTCNSLFAKELLELAALQGIKSEVLDKLADKMDSNETDHLLMLQMMGVDSITEHYIQTLLDKYGFDILDPNEIPELEGIPIPDINKDDGIIVNPIPEPGNDDQSVGFPIQPSDKDDGIFAGPKVTTGHWGDLLITQDVADLINSSEKGRETKGRSKIYERNGGMDKANEDFDSLNPTNVKDIGVGRTGILPDGTTVIVRSRSSGGEPTLEIQSKTKSIKFRY